MWYAKHRLSTNDRLDAVVSARVANIQRELRRSAPACRTLDALVVHERQKAWFAEHASMQERGWMIAHALCLSDQNVATSNDIATDINAEDLRTRNVVARVRTDQPMTNRTIPNAMHNDRAESLNIAI